MTADERGAYARDGFVVRRGVFGPDELEALRGVVDAVAAGVAARATRPEGGPAIRLPDGHRIQFTRHAVVQWEWAEGSREIRLIEPCDHLHPDLRRLFGDARFVEPMRDAVGSEDVALFTSKLNLKRPREGSEFPYHQDFPYWYARVEDDARDVATAILFLDDADAENGALRVIPGSHDRGPAKRDPDDPTRSLADPRCLDPAAEVLVEAEAGSVLFFGSLLVHRSAPNRSERPRRAVLPSYQPAGRPHWRDTPYHPEWIERLP
jgi:ectoine hydroxylase